MQTLTSARRIAHRTRGEPRHRNTAGLVLTALPRLAAGESVTTVAIDLGYNNPAAFTTMFKRVLGSSPRAYLQENR